ncbi:hypothetical protein PI124_g20152, partial [Phytophthora idaei]
MFAVVSTQTCTRGITTTRDECTSYLTPRKAKSTSQQQKSRQSNSNNLDPQSVHQMTNS